MKAQRVKNLDPHGPLADNLERIVRVRQRELFGFMPRAASPDEVDALHDMRIAAKRLRYILEIASPCFGEYAGTAVKTIKELQDLLGEIHDCDVQVDEVRGILDGLVADDARALAEAAAVAGGGDVPAEALASAPHRAEYAGLVALTVHLSARRRVLFDAFIDFWRDLERRGFGARLAYAITERPPRPGREDPTGTEREARQPAPEARRSPSLSIVREETA